MDDADRTSERASGGSGPDDRSAGCYEVRVSGRLGPRWGARFDGLTLIGREDGTTVIRGPVVDQAALHGLLQQLSDLGLTLLSLVRTAPGGTAEHGDPPSDTTRTNTPGATS